VSYSQSFGVSRLSWLDRNLMCLLLWLRLLLRLRLSLLTLLSGLLLLLLLLLGLLCLSRLWGSLTLALGLHLFLMRLHCPHPQLRDVLFRSETKLGSVSCQLLSLLLCELLWGQSSFCGFGGELLLHGRHLRHLLRTGLARRRHGEGGGGCGEWEKTRVQLELRDGK
jgi:hypothetical protein